MNWCPRHVSTETKYDGVNCGHYNHYDFRSPLQSKWGKQEPASISDCTQAVSEDSEAQQTLERHQDLESNGYPQSQSRKGWNTHLEFWSYERILWPWLEGQCIQEEHGQLQTGLGAERQTAVGSSQRSSSWYFCGRWRKGARNRRPRVSNILKKYFNIMYISCVCLAPEEDMGCPRRDYEQLGITRWMKSSKTF